MVNVKYWTVLCGLLVQLSPIAQAAEAGGDAQLKAKFASMDTVLKTSPFGRPLIIESKEASDSATGEVYALVNYPYPRVNAALKNPTNWCDIMILHQNTKYCKPSENGSNTELKMLMGKKTSQELDDAHKMDLNFNLIKSSPSYFSAQLDADVGPMGTKNYKVLVEAIPANNKQTFLHFSYSYAFGMAGNVAIKAYLASAGRNKIGFSPRPDGSGYIGGVRGMVERNTMRYYLAIDSYLGAMTLPADKQMSKRLQDWYTATERYPRQLHEITRNAYLSMKRDEIRRMESM